jgi:hypothetical protein
MTRFFWWLRHFCYIHCTVELGEPVAYESLPLGGSVAIRPCLRCGRRMVDFATKSPVGYSL